MNMFPLPDQAFNTLHTLSQVIPDTRRYVFDQHIHKGWSHEKVSLNAPSKRQAKKDKVARREMYANGVKPIAHLQWHLRNAGVRQTA